MRQLAATEPQDVALEDAGPQRMLEEDPRALATRFAERIDRASGGALDQGPAAPIGGIDQGGYGAATTGAADTAAGAGLAGDITAWLWNGAKEALRQLTFWQMKRRAGNIGQQGLGPFLADLHEGVPKLRIHLIGHSFGARLVCFSLTRLEADVPSPVASLTMLEGAFSHFAFAEKLPQDQQRHGALYGMMARVAGPLLACYSSHDLALAIFYPAASLAAGEDAAGLIDDATFRWGAIGHDGAQGVDAASINLGASNPPYAFAAGQFTNVDSSAIISQGSPPAGAHGDIFHPELGRLLLAAAGLAPVV
jgi:hypothetical protein